MYFYPSQDVIENSLTSLNKMFQYFLFKAVAKQTISIIYKNGSNSDFGLKLKSMSHS